MSKTKAAAAATAITAALLTIPATAHAAVTRPAPAAAVTIPAATHHHMSAREARRRHLAHIAHLKHLARLARLAAARRRHPARHPRRHTTTVILQAAYSSPKATAAAMLSAYGWAQTQMTCLTPLWTRESGWNTHAYNPSSGAYGIPQALPGSKMSTAGGNWRNDAATQIRWGLSYIKAVYGTPCGALAHSNAHGWY